MSGWDGSGRVPSRWGQSGVGRDGVGQGRVGQDGVGQGGKVGMGGRIWGGHLPY